MMRKQVCGTRDHKPSFSFGINRVQSWGWGGAIQGGFLEEEVETPWLQNLLLCHSLV